jgi:hypothetical protein
MQGAQKLCFLLVLAFALTPSAFSESPAAHAQDPQLRPCTDAESATRDSEEAASLIAGNAIRDKNAVLPFIWCVAADQPWFPGASILRFRTLTHVDFSLIYTFVRATNTSKLRLIRSCEGFCSATPPDLPDALGAMNELLRRAKPAPDDSQLASISNFYFFLLDRENGHKAFPPAGLRHPSLLNDYKATLRRNGTTRIVSFGTMDGAWLLSYSRDAGALHLDSVTRDPSDK